MSSVSSSSSSSAHRRSPSGHHLPHHHFARPAFHQPNLRSAPPAPESAGPRLAMSHDHYRSHSPPPPPPHSHHRRPSSPPLGSHHHRHAAGFRAQPPMRPSKDLHPSMSRLPLPPPLDQRSSWPPSLQELHHGMGGGNPDHHHPRGLLLPHEMGAEHHGSLHDHPLRRHFLPHQMGAPQHPRHPPPGPPRSAPPRYCGRPDLASSIRAEFAQGVVPPFHYAPPPPSPGAQHLPLDAYRSLVAAPS